MELVLISLASLLAGGIDSIVGGGGLILVPALFAVYPTTAPATLFGTNKSASVWGTSIATVQYSRRVQMRWAVLLPAAGAALAGSFIGAWVVTLIDPTFLRRLLPFILLAVLLYTLAKKDLGRTHAPRHTQARETALACAIGAVIGWYDGFFGPGTGSFMATALVALFGMGLVSATAHTKYLNLMSNLAALITLVLGGQVLWLTGFVMAGASLLGGQLGAHLALRVGSRMIRPLLVLMSLALTVKLLMDPENPLTALGIRLLDAFG